MPADISVVTPSYNQAEFIAQTLDSVISQRDVDVQYIVVDGGSKDGTRDVLDRYEDRIDHLIIEPDDGQADALRKGFCLASADICAYLNSDDYYLPGAFKRVVAFFAAHPGIDAVYGDRIYVDGDDRLLRYWRLPSHSNFINCRWDFIPQEACFWRRSAMERVGGIDTSYSFAVDYDLFARLMRDGSRFAHIPEFLAVFREHQRSKTTSQWESTGAPEVARVRKTYGFDIEPYHMPLAAMHYALLRVRSGLYRWRYPRGPMLFQQRAASSGTSSP